MGASEEVGGMRSAEIPCTYFDLSLLDEPTLACTKIAILEGT